MTVEYTRIIMNGVNVDGDGFIHIDPDECNIGGEIEFSINDIKRIQTVAVAHHYAYQSYKNRGYEDGEKYKSDFDFLATM